MGFFQKIFGGGQAQGGKLGEGELISREEILLAGHLVEQLPLLHQIDVGPCVALAKILSQAQTIAALSSGLGRNSLLACHRGTSFGARDRTSAHRRDAAG